MTDLKRIADDVNVWAQNEPNGNIATRLLALRDQLDALAGAEPGGWYCAHCEQGVDPADVTFNEAHTACGRIITNDVAPASSQPARITRDALELAVLQNASMEAALHALGIEVQE